MILFLLYWGSVQNFLLFHTLVEFAGIGVAFALFIIAWNTRRVITSTFFLLIGISFLFIGSLDLLHTIAYKGMGVIPGSDADLPTQLWIAARYFQAIVFLLAGFFIGRTISKDRNHDAAIILAVCTAALGLIVATLFVWDIFPTCFVERTGLTLFKIASEYVISLILVFAAILVYRNREAFDADVWRYLVTGLVFLILGELAFTSYVSVYGFMNMLGHLLRLISVYFFYRAFVVVALTRPYDLIFRELSENRDALQTSEKKYRTLLRVIPTPICVVDIEGRLVYVNDRFTLLFGYTRDEVCSLDGWWKRAYPDAAYRQWVVETWDADVKKARLDGSDIQPREYRVTCRDGNKRIVEISGILLEKHFMATFLDVTDRRQAEVAFREANQKLNILNSITRHDINNQLMALNAYLELMKMDSTTPEMLGHLKKAERAATTIHRQIEFTRSYQDIGVKAAEWQEVEKLIALAVRQIGPTGITIDQCLCGLEIFADPLVEKVFYNLLENSLRHGETVTRMGFSCQETPDGLILVYVDNGVGIADDVRGRLFEKGFGQNTGLGLFLSREILQITGITITENGEAGKGVRFEIRVPNGTYRFR